MIGVLFQHSDNNSLPSLIAANSHLLSLVNVSHLKILLRINRSFIQLQALACEENVAATLRCFFFSSFFRGIDRGALMVEVFRCLGTLFAWFHAVGSCGRRN